MLEDVNDESFNSADSIDYVLKDMLSLLKEQRMVDKKNELSYLKMVELFFKGMDVREKVVDSKPDTNRPQFNIVSGVDFEDI